MTMMDGSLQQKMLEEENCYSVLEKLQFCKQLSSAVVYLHKSGIIHADIALRCHFNFIIETYVANALDYTGEKSLRNIFNVFPFKILGKTGGGGGIFPVYFL